VFDVGGQRNERSKWIHSFENVTSIMFVAAISEFDQRLMEDAKVNRLKESLILFEEVLKIKYLLKKDVILFLNKRDLFVEKIQAGAGASLKREFPKYQGDARDVNAALEFVGRLFDSVSTALSQRRAIYRHFTCATDTTSVDNVFKSCRMTLITNSLNASGLF